MRNIQPAYSTGNVDQDLFEDVNCGFASQVYAKFARARYGVETCLADRFDEMLIKKRLLDLNMLYEPYACVAAPCCEPCGVTVTIQVFITYSCPPPQNVVVTVTDIGTVGPPPSNVSGEVVFSN